MNVPAEILRARSVIETPILDERKWGKVPGLAADAVMLDLEDSVPPGRKPEARQKVLEYLATPQFFGGRLRLVRPNSLSTPWGEEDLVALGQAGVSHLMYPKLRSADELRAVQGILRHYGADPHIFAIIETAQSLLNLEAIAQVDRVVALMVGPSDLSSEMGMALYDDDGTYNDALLHLLTVPVPVAKAHGLALFGAAFAPDIRDVDDVRRRIGWFARAGYTAMVAFYPPHLALIEEAFCPRPEALVRARSTIELYEQALARGVAGVQTAGGAAVLIHDYIKAKHLLAKVSSGGGK